MPDGSKRVGWGYRRGYSPVAQARLAGGPGSTAGQAYAHQHALGGALDDDGVSRLARDLAADLGAAPIA
jgi:hypothetical protein